MNIATYITHSVVEYWHFQERQADIIRRMIPGCRVTVCESEAAFLQALPEADAVLTWVFRQEWFAQAPRLKVISTPAAGKDYFHVTPPFGVAMLNGHFHGEFIGETVIGMLLAMIRGILPNATAFADVPWARHELTPRLSTLRGSTVTILGFGHIGQWIGKLAKPFGATIWGMTRHPHPDTPAWFTDGDGIFQPGELDARLAKTDHLVLALPGGADTDNVMDARRLSCLPPWATIANIGRGNAIDEDALMAMLRTGRLRGAVLDVFKQEPLAADNPVRSCPNLWTLPHASAIAPQYLDTYAAEVAQELQALG